MPHNSSNRARRARARGPANSLAKIFMDEWSDEWVEVADQLCVALSLPDLTTKSGLRKIHGDLDDTQKRLTQTFKYAKRYGNIKVMGGVISIWTKLCTLDTILQDRLIEVGFLDRILSLTEVEETRVLALRAINALTFHSGKRFCHELARYFPALIKLMGLHSDDSQVLTLIIAIFAHSRSLVVKTSVHLNVQPLLSSTLDAVKTPRMTNWMFDHAVAIFEYLAEDHKDHCRDNIPLTTFCIALLRSKDLRRRIQGLEMLFEICTDGLPRKKQHISAFTLASAVKKELPSDLELIVDQHGRDNCQMFMIKRASDHYVALHADHSLNPDLVKFGRGIASEMLSSPYAVPTSLCKDCAIQCHCGEDNGLNVILQESANALRKTGTLGDIDYADMLQYKSLALKRCHKDTVSFLKNAISRNPEFPFFYFALAAEGDEVETLKAAKKGLKCPNIPDWMRTALYRYACTASFYRGIRGCPDSSCSCEDRDECIALIMSAHEDSTEVVKTVAPDALQVQRDLSLHIIITMMMRGPQVDLESPEIKECVDKIALNKKFMEYLQNPITNRTLPLQVCETVFQYMPEAIDAWSDMLQVTNDLMETQDNSDLGALQLSTTSSIEQNENGGSRLDEWLQNIDDEPASDSSSSQNGENSRAQFWSDIPHEKLDAMRCSWCARTSAVLKKCGKCGISKYCDSECQKAHWKEHKQLCQTNGRKLLEAPPTECDDDHSIYETVD
ncbi:hypothetical protein C8Q75DRAFT_735795 [Abortiporus biennis]|nr:hypothetical protein C8Q75DRAFT_735795 [Abortiporus biennis]